MKITSTLLFFLLLNYCLKAQEFNLFTLTTRPMGIDNHKSTGFVSLSDIDRMNEYNDSLAIPKDNSSHGYEKFSYMQMGADYRTQLFSRTSISETDQVFIYSYSEDVITSIPISDLKVVSWLNVYTNPSECPCPHYYYQVGLEIDLEFLNGYEDYYSNTLVFIGVENPFIRNQIKPVVWQEIDSADFPTNLVSKEVNFNHGNDDYEFSLGSSYRFENLQHQFFIQKLMKDNYQFGLRLVVLNTESKEKIDERLYFSSESTSFASLDNQWTGNLLKNKAPVIFGFRWISFGCPSITLLASDEGEMVINCDNRH